MKRRESYQRPRKSVERFTYILIGSIAGSTRMIVGIEVFGL